MSVHPSLKTKGAVSEKRNVLKRHERIDQLKKEGIRKVSFAGSDEHHREYLQKMGFVKKEDLYIKEL